MMSSTRAFLGARASAAAAAIVAVVGIALMSSATSAVAAPTAVPAPVGDVGIAFSSDGVNFSPDAVTGLLDSLGTLIPGDTARTSMWVRNDSGIPAVIRVSVRDLVTPSRAYADGVWMDSWNSGTDETIGNSLQNTARCSVIVPSQAIGVGETMRVQLSFTMADFGGQEAQGQNAGMSLMIAMRDAEGGAFAASACDDDGVLIAPTPQPTQTGEVPGNSTTPAPGTAFSVAPLAATPNNVQLSTESVASAGLAPIDVTVWGFTLLRLTGEDLTALFMISAGLASGVGMFVLAARRQREREES